MGNLKKLKDMDFGARSFAFVDVEEYVDSQGIEFTKSGDWLKMRCILPFGHIDSSPSMFIHRIHGGWNCFRCGKGSWKELCDLMDWEVNIESISIDKMPESIWKESTQRIKDWTNNKSDTEIIHSAPVGLKKIDKGDKDCVKHLAYLKDRNIVNLIKTFNISYTNKGNKKYGTRYVNRLIIPCHNDVGKYIWCEGRAITHKKVDKKYIRPFGVNKVKYLFNYHRVKKAKFNYIIVVEGIIDAMILWVWGFPGVCCYGSNVSDEQVQLLVAFDHIYVCLDNDTAGIKGWLGVRKKLFGVGVNVSRIILPKNKDINDISENKFKSLFKRAKNII